MYVHTIKYFSTGPKTRASSKPNSLATGARHDNYPATKSKAKSVRKPAQTDGALSLPSSPAPSLTMYVRIYMYVDTIQYAIYNIQYTIYNLQFTTSAGLTYLLVLILLDLELELFDDKWFKPGVEKALANKPLMI